MGSTGDAAAILGCTTSGVRKLIEQGRLKNVVRQSNSSYVLDLNEVRDLRKMEGMAEGTAQVDPDDDARYAGRDRLADRTVEVVIDYLHRLNTGETPLPKVY